MRRRIMTFVAAAALTFDAVPLFAHDNFRIIGTLMKYQGSKIEVKSKDSKTTSIRLDKQTVISRDKQKVDTAELKVGRTVVVDALGDSEADLLALEIRIVPTIAARPAK